MKRATYCLLGLLLAAGGVSVIRAATPATLAPMLDLPGTGQDPMAIEFRTLPIIPGSHAIVSHGNAPWPFRNHSYLAYFGGRYWCMWSHGLRQEDYPEQHVEFSTSTDGLLWTEARPVVGPSKKKDFRYIARGFWIYQGRLLALASHDEALDDTGKKKLFGPSLQLMSWAWNEATKSWQDAGVIHDDAINNFPPTQLPDGSWAMICRTHEHDLFVLKGGIKSASAWTSIPLMPYASSGGFRPNEPALWNLADGRLLGLFRDNGKSQRIFRAISGDGGATWSSPEKTNFPDAASKIFGLRTSRGYYAMVSNANPAPMQRVPLCLSVSEDGITFNRLVRLPVPTAPEDYLPRTGERHAAGFQYPHMLEQDGSLLVVYSRNMTTVEVVKVSLDDVDRLRRSETSTWPRN